MLSIAPRFIFLACPMGLLACLMMGGCATAPSRPVQQMSRSSAAIDAARDGGAEDVPSAAVHLQLARQQVEQAQHLIESNQPERAEYLLMRAEADAELALALAREAPARALAQDALDRVQALEDSLELQTTDSAEDEGAKENSVDQAPTKNLLPPAANPAMKPSDPFFLPPSTP